MKDKLLIALIFLLLGGIIVYFKFPKIKEVEKVVYKEIIKTDTLIVEKIRYVKAKAKIDTLIKKDTVIITDTSPYDFLYAYADTTILEDNLKLYIGYDYLSTTFDIKYWLKQREIIREIPIKQNKFGIMIGIQSGFNPFNQSPYIGVGFTIGYLIK